MLTIPAPKGVNGPQLADELRSAGFVEVDVSRDGAELLLFLSRQVDGELVPVEGDDPAAADVRRTVEAHRPAPPSPGRRDVRDRLREQLRGATTVAQVRGVLDELLAQP